MHGDDGIDNRGTNDLLQSGAENQQEAPDNRPTFMSVFDRHMCYPFFIKLCEHLSIAEIVAWTRTCKKYADLYQYLLPVQWDVDRRLRRFVRDPYGFRSQMAKSDALIAGSFVTQFFERTSCETSDLNIFVEDNDYVDGGERANMFQSYLVNEEGYTEIPPTKISKYEPSEVHKFLKLSNHARIEHEEEECTMPSSTKVQVYLLVRMPIESILEFFCSTVVVNFMSWNKAYSVFPLSTFVQYKGYELGAKCPRSCFLKEYTGYPLRGWNMQDLMRSEEKRLNHPIRTYRRVGDGFTWTIPFDTENVQGSKLPDYVLEYACFQMQSRQTTHFTDYQIFTYEYKDRTLKYRYLSNWDMLGFIRDKIDCSTAIEPRKMDQSARSGVRHPRMEPWGGSISLDAKIPDWYREWERQIGDGEIFPEFYERSRFWKPVYS